MFNKKTITIITYQDQLTMNGLHLCYLKLSSLFMPWLFWTIQNKSHNVKALGHFMSLMITISPTYLLIWKKRTFVGLCAAFWSIFTAKCSPLITHLNHMTMTTCWQISLWPDYSMTKKSDHKVVRLVWEFDCLHFTQYMPRVHIALTINWHDILLM